MPENSLLRDLWCDCLFFCLERVTGCRKISISKIRGLYSWSVVQIVLIFFLFAAQIRITEILRKKPAEITDKIYENSIQHPNLAHAPGLSGAYMAGQNRRIFSVSGHLFQTAKKTVTPEVSHKRILWYNCLF